jgi:hypothetical protein
MRSGFVVKVKLSFNSGLVRPSSTYAESAYPMKRKAAHGAALHKTSPRQGHHMMTNAADKSSVQPTLFIR